MTKSQNIETGHRLKIARKNAGMTVEDVAESTGQAVETVRSHEKGARGVRADVLAKYARVYNMSPDLLRTGRRGTATTLAVSVEGMPVIGVVQAGAFREHLELPTEEQERLPVQYDSTYAKAAQFALRVEGRSMDMVYPPGSYVICVSLEDSDARIGDHVVCRRHRGGLYEFTLKELWFDPKVDRPRLIPRSTDTAYQDPIDMTEGEVEIIAVVIGAYFRRQRRGPAM